MPWILILWITRKTVKTVKWLSVFSQMLGFYMKDLRQRKI